MEDVKEPQESVEQPAEAPAEQESQPVESTDTSVVQETKSINEPDVVENYKKAMLEERKKRQDIQRRLASKEAGERMGQYDEKDLQSVMSHPIVQELMLKDAKRELTDYSRDLLDKFPNIPEIVKKAILKNVRGFVSESTTDVETAKIDILEYVEGIAAEIDTTKAPAQKGFPVATTNQPTAESQGANAAEIGRILDKPIDEMTEDEIKLVQDYQKRQKK